MQDYHGEPIPTAETPDTQITVWEISPALNTDFDSCVIRPYHDFVDYAQRVIEQIMDNPDQEYPAVITISQPRMTVAKYEELCGEGEA